MSIFKKKSKVTSEEKLYQSISQFFGNDLWNLCRGNYDFFVNAIKDGSASQITSALRKIDKYSSENLEKMLSLQEEYLQETK